MRERVPGANAENAGKVAQLCVYKREEDGIFCLGLSFHFPLLSFLLSSASEPESTSALHI